MNTSATVPEIHVSVRGEVPADGARYAREKIGSTLRFAPVPVLHAKIRLVRDPAVHPGVLAQVNLDLNGRPVRVQVRGTTAAEAADLLSDRLRRRLSSMQRYWDARHGNTRNRQSRRREDRAAAPVPVPRDRRVVRHKSFTLSRCTVDDAAFEMNLMDYDFHLFTEANTGQDSVLHRGEDAGYLLAQVEPRPAEIGPTRVALTVVDRPAMRMAVPAAARLLDEAGEPFVFFVADGGDRGCVLYRRHDGQYGLVCPAGAADTEEPCHRAVF
jgi:hypothetical protein